MNQAHARNDFVLTPDESLQHSDCIVKIARLPESLAVEHHYRVRADHDRFAMLAGDSVRFPLGVLHRQHLGCGAAELFLDAVGLHYAEVQPHFAQQLFTPG
jgi:hypothetical protein